MDIAVASIASGAPESFIPISYFLERPNPLGAVSDTVENIALITGAPSRTSALRSAVTLLSVLLDI